MHWNQFLDSAKRFAQGRTEGDWCSGMSRGYYAVFHQWRSFLETAGISVGRSGQSHFTIYAGIFNCGSDAMANMARRLDALRLLRIAADYDLQKGINQSLASIAVQEAAALVEDFDRELSAVDPQQIIAGVRQYLQSIGRLHRGP